MKARYVVAVSGGVDSVVLLDRLVREAKNELIVAHFDHGIRDDSSADARFVEALAQVYGLQYEGRREELGKQCSEELARTRRYEFLFGLAKKYQATLVTAHHSDDVVETIAINLIRGTGWRGLAVFDNPAVERPQLGFTKSEIRSYALENRLEWVEDETNSTDAYLRNRLRYSLGELFSLEQRMKLLDLWRSQKQLAQDISHETEPYLKLEKYSRYFFTNVDWAVASEVLRAILVEKYKQPLTRPQRERAIQAIRTTRTGKTAEIGEGLRLKFRVRDFSIETNAPVL